LPFKSEKQRRFLWANHPKIAEAWAHGKSSVTGKKESAKRRGKRKKAKRGLAHRGKTRYYAKRSGKRKSKRAARR